MKRILTLLVIHLSSVCQIFAISEQEFCKKHPPQEGALDTLGELAVQDFDINTSWNEKRSIHDHAIHLITTTKYCGKKYGLKSQPATKEETLFLQGVIRSAFRQYDRYRDSTLNMIKKSLEDSNPHFKIHLLAVESYVESLKNQGKILESMRQKILDLGKQYSEGRDYSSTYDPKGYFKQIIIPYIERNSYEDLFHSEWPRLYFRLWSLAGVKGPDYVKKNYKDILDIMRENNVLYDENLQLPITEFGFFYDAMVKIRRPFDGKRHKILIFGSGKKYKEYHSHGDNAYTVNVLVKEDPDLLADMNNPKHLISLPDKQFDKIIVEHIPAMDYYNPSFFNNAKRLLKDNGRLVINIMEYMQNSPYEVNFEEFFQKNGFKIEEKTWSTPGIQFGAFILEKII